MLADVASDPRFPVVMRLLIQNGILSYCAIPFFTERRQIGSLGFGSTEKAAYSDGDNHFMNQVARQVVVAVEKTLNYEAAARSQAQLSTEPKRAA
jgi:GAF domain-containing protein